MKHVCEMGVKVERMSTYAQLLSPGKAKTLLSKYMHVSNNIYMAIKLQCSAYVLH